MSIRLYKFAVNRSVSVQRRSSVQARCILKLFRLVGIEVSVTGGARTISGYGVGEIKTTSKYYSEIKEVLSDT